MEINSVCKRDATLDALFHPSHPQKPSPGPPTVLLLCECCVDALQQAHMQPGMVQSHHPGQTHPTMMLMATQGPPGGPQQQMPQNALNPIPVSSTTHFSYLAHPQGMFSSSSNSAVWGGGQKYVFCSFDRG